jgi:SAM-dependent methyltransferase
MGKLANQILSAFHQSDPYAQFPYHNYPLDLQGGPEDQLLDQLIEKRRPSLIVEVGTWKGASALQMAACMKRLGIDGAVVCVDTWLGSLEHLTKRVQGCDLGPHVSHGYPTLYFQFLANVLHKGMQDLIVPVPTTSAIGARWLAHHRCQADVVYLDGSHDEEDVYQDVASYWKILRPGGILLGDDWHAFWHGVICGVNRFVKENGLNLQVVNTKWLLEKSRE